MPTWNIVNTIDEGGFGKVHEVRSKENGQRGALKVLKNAHSANKKRFEREVDILQKFSHKHIIEIHDWNLNGSPPDYGPWYVMEFMEGGSLHGYMHDMFNRRQGLFARKWTFETVIFPVIDAIEYAHARNVYHRDLKPANLLFTTPDRRLLKVADWGIGKDINRTSIALTVGGIGTTGYCAPEQWFALNVDGRADIFSLGIIFYQMMTGKMPPSYNFSGHRAMVIPPSHLHNSIPPQLDAAILKMIDMKANLRYQNMKEVRNALMPIYRTT